MNLKLTVILEPGVTDTSTGLLEALKESFDRNLFRVRNHDKFMVFDGGAIRNEDGLTIGSWSVQF